MSVGGKKDSSSGLSDRSSPAGSSTLPRPGSLDHAILHQKVALFRIPGKMKVHIVPLKLMRTQKVLRHPFRPLCRASPLPGYENVSREIFNATACELCMTNWTSLRSIE
jgi:hypothetical protein